MWGGICDCDVGIYPQLWAGLCEERERDVGAVVMWDVGIYFQLWSCVMRDVGAVVMWGGIFDCDVRIYFQL